MGETDYPTSADYANSAAQDARQAVADLERRMSAHSARQAAAIAVASQPGSQHAEIEQRFSFHPATTPERQAQHEAVRDACKRLAHALDRIVPAGRPKSLALTAVEEAMHWANAGVACQPPPPLVLCGDVCVQPANAPCGREGCYSDGRSVPLVVPRDEVPPGRTYCTHTDHPDTVHDVPIFQRDDHAMFIEGATCPCEPVLQPYRGGLLHVHNAF